MSSPSSSPASPAVPGTLLGDAFPLVLKKLIENPPKNFLDAGDSGEDMLPGGHGGASFPFPLLCAASGHHPHSLPAARRAPPPGTGLPGNAMLMLPPCSGLAAPVGRHGKPGL